MLPVRGLVAVVSIGLAAAGVPACPAGEPPRREAVEPTLAEEGAFRAAVDRIAGAVVRIEPAAGGEAAGSINAGPSSGLVIDPRGLILAAEFAVADGTAEVVVLTPAGDRRIARVRGRDRSRGLVLLETDPLPDAPPLETVSRDRLQPGQWAIAVGRGWQTTEAGVSVGIVSATGRCWGLAVQTDAAVSPMNYGGPLVDVAGRVIGLVVPLPADTAGMKRGSDLYDSGIGFAIPLTDVLPLVPRLLAGEVLEPGVLGLAWESRDSINGAPVVGVVAAGSPAAAAGLAGGDRIVAVAGREVRRVADVRHALAPLHAGDDVVIAVERAADPARLSLTATLADRLPPARRGVLGIVAAATADAAGDEATRIAWLLPDGPAAAAGAMAGDTVASLAAVPPGAGPTLASPAPPEVARFIAGLAPGQAVRLELARGGSRLPLEIVLASPPTIVPADGPRWAQDHGPLEGAVEPVKVVRLDAAEAADRPLAVVPRSGTGPLGVLVHCGPPRGGVADDAAAPWRAAVAETGVAVILPGSSDRLRWSRDDVPGVLRAIQSLAARRGIDPDRVAVSGTGAGGAFAWLVAERLGPACRGVAVVDAPLPSSMTLATAGPGEARWILVGGGEPGRRAADRRRLEDAGHVVGPAPEDAGAMATTLCRWVSLLGLL